MLLTHDAREATDGALAHQVDRYLNIARDHGLDGVLTTSSQITRDPAP
jgi:hypothetical protein